MLLLLLTALIIWEKRNHENELILELKDTARAYFEQIVISRLWNANHGGVYVEVTDKVQPNPYLADDPERDVISVSGKRYTKINPAYMTRQLSELASQRGRYKFHITSLHLVNPANEPDTWEIEQLRLFGERKQGEAYEIVNDVKGERFRYMAPLIIESPCLGCHQKYGYKLGDVRGGISIDIPIEIPKSIHAAMAKRSTIAFSVIGASVLFFIFTITLIFSKKIVRDIEKEIENERLKGIIRLAGAAAHELR